MDTNALSIRPRDLCERLGTARAPVIIDVRRAPAFDADPGVIAGSTRRMPEHVTDWREHLPAGRPVVVYCVHGHEVSQQAATALRQKGIKATYLKGGITAWRESGFPTRRKRSSADSKWVTREHPKIDRIACPWLVSRFINPD